MNPAPERDLDQLHRLRPGDAGDGLPRHGGHRGLQEHRQTARPGSASTTRSNRAWRNAGDIAIATHPQHMLFVDIGGRGALPLPRRRRDLAEAGRRTATARHARLFADADSTRLYRATAQGLFFSSDAGDTWQRAAGVIGQIQTTALGYADADGHTILYAATNGGSAATSRRHARRRRLGSARAAASTLVGAGIYRYVVLPPEADAQAERPARRRLFGLGRYVTAQGHRDAQRARRQQGQAAGAALGSPGGSRSRPCCARSARGAYSW